VPSSSTKQQHFMFMVKAVQAGHHLKGISKETNKAVHKAADSMTAKQVQDFATVATRKHKKA
jgi:hypothetical protein